MIRWEKFLLFVFWSHAILNARCIAVLSVWADGWLASEKQVDNVAAEGFTVGWRGRGGGLGALFGKTEVISIISG